MDRPDLAENHTRGIGARWEAAALELLQHRGLTLVARNFNSRFGELDLVMRDGAVLVFVEVRYRDNARHGDGTVSVGAAKRTRLIRAASLYLQANSRFAGLPCRFDVVGCSGTLAAPAFEWTKSAFDAF